MSAVLIRSFAPPQALKLWLDDRNIYAEIPLSPGYNSNVPCIIAYPITEAGLNKALNLLRQRRTDFAGTPLAPISPHAKRTPEQSSILRAIIRNGA